MPAGNLLEVGGSRSPARPGRHISASVGGGRLGLIQPSKPAYLDVEVGFFLRLLFS